MHRSTLLIVPMVLMSACADMNGMGGRDAASSSSASMQDPAAASVSATTYVTMAGASDRYEIESSQRQQAAGSSAAVKAFAAMMIAHHTRTTADLRAATTQAGMTPPPPQLEPKQADMIAQLRGAQGAALDQIYLTQQRQAHQEALALHQGYANNGDQPALRQVAAKAVPIIESHIRQLQSLS